MYQIGLACSYYFTNDRKTILDDYSWWTSLIEQICKNANRFEIRCWPGETEAIETGEYFGIPVKNTTTDELVFKVEITDEFKNEIFTNFLTQYNCLKWFTLIFYRDETILFLSEHYGSEAHLLHVTANEISSVKSWIDQFSGIKIVYIDKMNLTEIDNDMINNDNRTEEESNDEISNLNEEGIKEISGTI